MGPDVHALHPGLPVNRLDCGSTAGCSESARRRSADSPAARADRHIPTPHIYPSIPSVSLACTYNRGIAVASSFYFKGHSRNMRSSNDGCKSFARISK